MGCETCKRKSYAIKHENGSEIDKSEIELLDQLDELFNKYNDELKGIGVKLDGFAD